MRFHAGSTKRTHWEHWRGNWALGRHLLLVSHRTRDEPFRRPGRMWPKITFPHTLSKLSNEGRSLNLPAFLTITPNPAMLGGIPQSSFLHRSRLDLESVTGSSFTLAPASGTKPHDTASQRKPRGTPVASPEVLVKVRVPGSHPAWPRCVSKSPQLTLQLHICCAVGPPSGARQGQPSPPAARPPYPTPQQQRFPRLCPQSSPVTHPTPGCQPCLCNNENNKSYIYCSHQFPRVTQ